MDRFVRDFWAFYTEAMSLLLSATKVNDLPPLEYLLEEDVDTIGFRPLQQMQMQRKLAVSESFLRRASLCEVIVKRQPAHIEMQYRIRDLLDDALELTENDVGLSCITSLNRSANECPVRPYQTCSRRRKSQTFCHVGRLDRLPRDQNFINRTFDPLSRS